VSGWSLTTRDSIWCASWKERQRQRHRDKEKTDRHRHRQTSSVRLVVDDERLHLVRLFQRETKRQADRQTETRHRDRDTEKTDRHRQRDGPAVSGWSLTTRDFIWCAFFRRRKRGRQTDRQRHRDTEIQRHRDKQTDTDRETDQQCQAGR
jgi:hypothetical protein